MRNRRTDPPTLIACCLLALAIALTPAPTRAASDDTSPEPTAIRIPLAAQCEHVGHRLGPAAGDLGAAFGRAEPALGVVEHDAILLR